MYKIKYYGIKLIIIFPFVIRKTYFLKKVEQKFAQS